MTVYLENFLPYRLSRLTEAMSQEIRRVYKDMYGLTRPEWRVLAALSELGEASSKKICEHSAQHKTKVSRAVASLEKRRWLKRREDPADRRSELLLITSAGRSAFDALSVPLLEKEKAILQRLSEAERKDLLQSVRVLESALLQTTGKA